VRHLYGTALAVVLTTVMFFAEAWGYHELLNPTVVPGQSSALPAGGGSLLSNSSALLALVAVVATGLLAGLLVMIRRLSPLAAGLPGLLLLAWTGVYLVSVRLAVELIPLRSQAFGAGWQALLTDGILSAAGAVLILPMCVPGRWRAASRDDDSGPSAREADEYLASVKASAPPWRRESEPELVGTVIPRTTGGFPRPAGDAFRPVDTMGDADATRPVDTTRVTGASRVLRNTGSFRVVTDPFPPSAAERGAERGTQHRAGRRAQHRQDPLPPDGW
jgi:hypothetical protein